MLESVKRFFVTNLKYWPFLILALFFGISFYSFFANFGFDLSNKDLKSWLDTATYFNNLFSPPLLLITIYLLYQTWKTSKREFEETRAEVKQSREIQNSTHIIELLRYRINHYNKELNQEVDEWDIKNGCIFLFSELSKEVETNVLKNELINAKDKGYLSEEQLHLTEVEQLEILNSGLKLKDVIGAFIVSNVKNAIKYNNSEILIDKLFLEYQNFTLACQHTLYRMLTTKSEHLISVLRKAHTLNELV